MANAKKLVLEVILTGSLIFGIPSVSIPQTKKAVEYIVDVYNVSSDTANVEKLTDKLKERGYDACTKGIYWAEKNITNYHTVISTISPLSKDELYKELMKDCYAQCGGLGVKEKTVVENQKEIEKFITGLIKAELKEDINQYMQFFNNEIIDLRNGEKLKLTKKELIESFNSYDFKKFKLEKILKNINVYSPKMLADILRIEKLDAEAVGTGDYGAKIDFSKEYPTSDRICVLRKIKGNWKIIGSYDLKN